MRIAIIAWGSLVWKPTDRGVTLRLRTPDDWRTDGPRLPVEFARISCDGSLTLVVVPSYPKEVTTLWSVSAHHHLNEAIRNLASREGITENLEAIHGVFRSGLPIGSVDRDVATTIHSWLLKRPRLDAAIWTGLGTHPTRWRDRGYEEGFTPDNALSYLRSLRGDGGHPAFEYLMKAPAQVTTPVRQRATEEGII